MKIRELKLKNFRCFNELTINFSDDYTIFIGNNGAGKSSILNALQIMLQTLVFNTQYDLRKSKADYFASQAIQESDARLKSSKIGSRTEQQPQYPVIINISVSTSNDKNISWNYELTNALSRTAKNTNEVLNYVQELQQKITNGDNVICPIIAYYGTKRQWNKIELYSEKKVPLFRK